MVPVSRIAPAPPFGCAPLSEEQGSGGVPRAGRGARCARVDAPARRSAGCRRGCARARTSADRVAPGRPRARHPGRAQAQAGPGLRAHRGDRVPAGPARGARTYPAVRRASLAARSPSSTRCARTCSSPPDRASGCPRSPPARARGCGRAAGKPRRSCASWPPTSCAASVDPRPAIWSAISRRRSARLSRTVAQWTQRRGRRRRWAPPGR